MCPPRVRRLSGVVVVNIKMGVPKVPGTRVKSTRLDFKSEDFF